jgi:hypothetical protein
MVHVTESILSNVTESRSKAGGGRVPHDPRRFGLGGPGVSYLMVHGAISEPRTLLEADSVNGDEVARYRVTNYSRYVTELKWALV